AAPARGRCGQRGRSPRLPARRAGGDCRREGWHSPTARREVAQGLQGERATWDVLARHASRGMSARRWVRHRHRTVGYHSARHGVWAATYTAHPATPIPGSGVGKCQEKTSVDYVVRGGTATADLLQKGYRQHRGAPQVYGLSVQYASGQNRTLKEL